jgi:hypothetical protein
MIKASTRDDSISTLIDGHRVIRVGEIRVSHILALEGDAKRSRANTQRISVQWLTQPGRPERPSIRRSIISVRFIIVTCDIKLGEWPCELGFSRGSQVSSDSLFCKQANTLFLDVISPFFGFPEFQRSTGGAAAGGFNLQENLQFCRGF